MNYSQLETMHSENTDKSPFVRMMLNGEYPHVKKRARYLAGIILFFNATLFAATYTWTGGSGTAWSTTANWGGAGYPHVAGDIAVFNSTANSVDLDASYNITNIQITSGFTGSFNFHGYTLTLTSPGANVSFDIGSPGTVSFSAGAKLTIILNTNKGFIPPARVLTLPDIIVQDGSAGSNRTLTQSTNELICNSLTVNGTSGTRTPIYSANALAFKAGALTVDSGTFTGGGAAGHDTITGNVILSSNAIRGGTLTLPTGLTTGYFIVGGNVTINAGTYTSTTGNATVAGTWSMPTAATATLTTGHLTVSSWNMGAGTFGVTTGTVAVTNGFTMSGGTFTVSSTGTVTVGGDVSLSGGTFKENSTGTLNAGGNWSNTGGTFTCGTGTVNFNGGSGPYTVTPRGNSFNILKFNNAGGTWNFSGATTAAAILTMTAGTLNVGVSALTCNAGLTAAGGTINASSATIAITGALTLSGAAFSAPDGSHSLSITTNFAKTAGSFTNNSGTLTLAGTAATNTIVTNNPTDLYNMAITSTGTYTVNSGIKFNNFSMATNGKLTIGTGKQDTVLGSLTVTNGSLVLNATASLAFPGNADLSAIKLITSNASSQFVFYGAGTQQLTQPTIAMTLPAIVHPGSGTLQFQNAISCKGFTQSGTNGPATSVLDFNGKNITLPSGSFTVNNGTSTTITGLGGITILVTAGNANFYGTSTSAHLLMDGASNWYIDVPTTYTLYALNCDIGHSCIHTGNASGTAVLSTDLTTNCAGPPNWVFSTINVWRGTNSTSWALGTNWSLSHSPASTEDAQFDNTAVRGCVLDMTTTIKNLTFLSTFTNNFSFGTTANILTVGGSSANFSMGAAATITLGTGTLTFSGTAAQDLVPPQLSSQVLPAITVSSGTANPLAVSANGLNCSDVILTASSLVFSTPGTTNQIGNLSASGASTLNLGSATTLKTNGATVNFTNIALTSDASDSLDFNGSSPQTFSPASQTFPNIKHDGAATLAVTPTAAWTANSFTQNGGAGCGFTLGGKNLTTTTDFTINNGNTGSFTPATTLNGRTITVGGNASLNGTSFGTYLDMDASSTGWNLKVTGTCNASYAHIAYCNASSSTGTATFSQDLSSTGANTNWTFIADWVSPGASTWGTAANWSSQQVPTLLTNATFDNNGLGNCQLSGATTVKALTMTSLYTGMLDFNGQSLTVTQGADFTSGGPIITTGGSLAFSSGTDAGSYLFIPDSGMSIPSLTKSGSSSVMITNYPITVTSSFSLAGGTWSWGTGLTSTVPSIAASGGTMDFGSSNVRVTTGNVSLGLCASVTNTSGNLYFLGSGTQTITPLSGATHPKIYVTGGGTLTLGGILQCAGLSISMSQFNFAIYTPLTITADALSASGGSTTFLNLGGKSISVTGRARFSGTPGSLINLNAAAWSITTTDSLFASYADIANSTASASMHGQALYGCTNDGGNSNWDFSRFGQIWHQGIVGSVSSGISTEGGTIYLATTGTTDTLSCRNSSDGSLLWFFPASGSNTISQPDFYYNGSGYNVAFTTGATGNQLAVLQDNGMQYSQMSYSPITLGGGNAGDPMITPDQSAICVVSTGHVAKYSLADGHALFDATDDANVSPGGDEVVYSDNIYTVTNDGKLEKRDFGTGLVIAFWSGGASAPLVDYPFAIADTIAYITGYSGTNGKLFAVDLTNLAATKWTWTMNAVASAPLFTSNKANAAWVANGKYLDKVVNGSTSSPGWEYQAANKITGGPVAVNPGNGPVYFSTNVGDYYALEDATGAIFNGNWPVHTSGSSTACTPWLDIYSWKFICGTANGGLDALPIEN
jgi:hypothetical protein